MNKETVLTNVAETITEKPAMLKVDVKPKNWFERILIKAKIKPSKRLFEIKPQRAVNIYRIAGRAVSIDAGSLFNTTDLLGETLKLMAVYADDVFYIVATAIQNDHREPTAKMIDIVRNEFTMQEIYQVMQIAVGSYNLQAFLNSIALIKGVDALEPKVSPIEKAEL